MILKVYAINGADERNYECRGLVFDFAKGCMVVLLEDNGIAIDIPLPSTIKLPDGFMATELRMFPEIPFAGKMESRIIGDEDDIEVDPYD